MQFENDGFKNEELDAINELSASFENNLKNDQASQNNSSSTKTGE